MINTPKNIEQHPWGQMEWLADHASHPGAQTSLAKMVVKPGVDTPLHRHDNCSEVLHVLQGEIEIHVGMSDSTRLTAGETHVFPAYMPHSLSNVGENEAVLMLSFSNANRHYQALDDMVRDTGTG